MAVFEHGYQRWDGALQERPLRWWPILRQGVMGFLPKRKYLFVLFMSWIPFIVAATELFTRLKGAELLEGFLGEGVDAGPAFFWKYVSFSMLPIVVFTLMVGTDLIAGDRRGRALQLYFSKPITRMDYLLGKSGVIAAFIGLCSWVPATLLWILALMLEPSGTYLGLVWTVPLRMILFYALLTAFVALSMLATSATLQRTTFVGVAWLLIFGVGIGTSIDLIASGESFEWIRVLNMSWNVEQVGGWIFGAEINEAVSPWLSLGGLIGATALAYWWVRRKIEPVEVVL